MSTWAQGYRDKFPHIELLVPGLEEMGPIKVKLNATILMADLMKEKYGIKSLNKKDIMEATAEHDDPFEMLADLIDLITIEPRIVKNEVDSTADNAIWFNNVDIGHVNAIIKAVNGRTGGEGEDAANTFPE